MIVTLTRLPATLTTLRATVPAAQPVAPVAPVAPQGRRPYPVTAETWPSLTPVEQATVARGLAMLASLTPAPQGRRVALALED
jgi:hypothetical protein